MLHGTFHDYRLVPAMDLDLEERDQAEPALFVEPELSGWMSSDSHARPILLEIYEFLNGTGAFGGSRCGERSVFDLVLPRLKMAFRNGEIVALRIQSSSVTAVARSEQPSVPEPPVVASERLTWFELLVVDEVGQPIGGLEIVLRYNGERKTRKTSPSGRARFDPVDAGFAFASIADVRSARELLKPRWDRPRGGPTVEPAEDVVVWHLRDEVPGVELRNESPRTVSIQPCVAQARLIGGFFDTSKSFLLPNGVEGVRGVVRTYDKHRGATILLVGHTDTAGDPSYNDPLSLERAESVAAYLTDDVDGWYKWYGPNVAHDKRWGRAEDQLMIEALPDASERGPTESRIRWFQRTRGLNEDGIAGEETRRALLGEYMSLDGTSLPKGMKVVTHGCGENFPREDTGDGVANPDNRRIEIFFFDDKLGVQPKPAGNSSTKSAKEYPEWLARAGEPVDFSTDDEMIVLDIEWADDVVQKLQEDVSIVLSGQRLPPQKRYLGSAERDGGVARISFGELGRSQSITLTAKKGDQELVLVRDQIAGDLDDAFVWEHHLEEFLVAEPPDDGELVAAGGPPDNAHEGPGPGEVLAV